MYNIIVVPIKGMIGVDFRHRFTAINKNDTPVPIGQIHSFHSYVQLQNHNKLL